MDIDPSVSLEEEVDVEAFLFFGDGLRWVVTLLGRGFLGFSWSRHHYFPLTITDLSKMRRGDCFAVERLSWRGGGPLPRQNWGSFHLLYSCNSK